MHVYNYVILATFRRTWSMTINVCASLATSARIVKQILMNVAYLCPARTVHHVRYVNQHTHIYMLYQFCS